jgi:hypothetical protein
LVQRGFERGDLAEVPYTVWLCMRIDGEIKNGGFSQLFYNLRGRVPVEEMTAALERIGCSDGAAHLEGANRWLTPAKKKKLYSSS